jgi:hypothetical protein
MTVVVHDPFDPFGNIVVRLEALHLEVVETNDGVLAQCPAHDDYNPSLHITNADFGALVYCFAGCETTDVLAALGMHWRDLYKPETGAAPSSGWAEPAGLPAALRQPQQTFDTSTLARPTQRSSARPRRLDSRRSGRRVVAVYDYVDPDGRPLYCVQRLEPKSFRQCRYDSNGIAWTLTGVERVLYRLPEVLEAVATGRRVFIAEGEKDVHALEDAGVVATTCSGGARGWTKVAEHAAAVLAGADVVIVADRDRVGMEHAFDVMITLRESAASVVIVRPFFGKDAHDHLAAGFCIADLVGEEDDEGGLTYPLARRKRYRIVGA